MSIERIPFGRTGHESLRTIFGGAALGRATEAEAEAAFDLILRYGIDHLDTAASYGDSELRIAPFLRREGRDRFFVATKTGKRSYAEARDEIRLSLERLGTDRIDLLQLHNLVDRADWDVAMGPDGALKAAIEARDAGLVRFIGVTGHGIQAPRLHRESLLRFPFDSVLFPYNRTQLRDAAYAADVEALLTLCRDRGVATQTIKAITLGPWPEQKAEHSTWYEPLVDQADIDTAVRYVLGRPGLFLNTPSDIGLLDKVLDAAARGGPAPSDAESDALIARRSMTPLFI
ncbi:MAG TPA: aldo/keto reductase [Candidatus Saccharimonadales bacterium]|nr:aldo/keto reductase [Candidatus Saccharimonadales bacterium]